MYVIKPVDITSAVLTSNIPEPDTGRGESTWTAGSYTTGTRKINTTTHRVYEVVATPSTTDDPLVGVNATPATWVDVGPTNKWAMFDGINNTSSVGDDIEVSIENNLVNTSIAGINVNNAVSINVTVVSDIEGEVYNTDIDMVDNSDIVDFFEYFFNDNINRTEFILSDLPFYSDVTITMTAMGTDVSIGSLLIGKQIYIGETNYGTGLQSLNFGTVNESPYGYVTFTPGNKAKLVDFDVTIQTPTVNNVFKQLESLIDIPTVWFATGAIDDPTLVFGYHRDSRINIAYPSISDCTIQVRGLT